MSMFHRFSLTFLTCLIFSAVISQDYRFRKLTTTQGLSQNSVNDIFQDSDGYIWLGTQDGLNLYDGNAFEHFRFTGSGGAIHDNFVLKMEEDNLGNLFVGHRKGITVYSKEQKRGYLIQPIPEVAYQPVKNIINVDGKIYLISSDLKLFQATLTAENRYQLKEVSLDTNWGKPRMTYCVNNISYLITDKFLISNFHESSAQKQISLPYLIKPGGGVDDGIAVSKDGMVYFVTGAYVLKYDPTKGDISPVLQPPTSGSITYLDVSMDDKDQLWVASNFGLYILNQDSVVSHILSTPENPNGLNGNLIHSVFRDQQNQMWVGTALEGALIYNAQIERFKFINQYSGLRNTTVWSIYQDENQLMVGTSGGLEVLKLKSDDINQSPFIHTQIKSSSYPTELINKKVLAIAKVNDYYWIASSSELFIFNSDLSKLIASYNSEDLGLEKTTVFVDLDECRIQNKQYVLLATFYGVFKFGLDGKYVGPIEALQESYFMDAFVQKTDSGDLLWVGSNDGVWKYQLDKGQLTKYSYIPNDTSGKSVAFQFVSSIAQGEKDELWLGTFGGGINRFDIKSERFTKIGEEDGLSNNVICSIAYQDSIVWASHNKGISRYDQRSGDLRNYDLSDGVVFDEFVVNSVFTNQKKQLFFGSANGLSAIATMNFPLQSKPDIMPKIGNLEINYGKSDATKAFNKRDNLLTLKPGDKFIKIDLSIPDYKANATRFQYRLIGFDSTWHNVERPSNQVSFSNLDPGNYVFSARVVDKHGSTGVNEMRIPIYVITPLWKRWWFLLLCGLISLAIVIVISRYFAQRTLKEKLIRSEADKRLLYEKQRISKDLHDNVGANITYLIHSLDNMAFKLDRDQRAVPPKELEALSDEARGTMDALRETIWAVNKDKVALLEFKNRFDGFASKMLSVANIKYKSRFTFDEQTKLTPFFAINLLRVMQETVHNAVKHSQASSLEVTFFYEVDLNRSDRRLVEVEITDDGVGFDMIKGKEGHFGLQNMKDRIIELGGVCTINSSPGMGTKLVIHIGE